MAPTSCLLAIDQGTTSSRAIIFNRDGIPLSIKQEEFLQIFPQEGWVEHDPEAIWQTTFNVVNQAIAALPPQHEILSIGITNQRETTVIWNKKTGKPIYNAIVWQDRRTAEHCRQLKEAGFENTVTRKTGLLLDPYFSATKISWILDNVQGARASAEKGELAFGTIDCFLLWRLTGGKLHATDATNASRTLFYNIHTHQWDEELLKLFNIPASMLPEVKNCAADYGVTELFGTPLPIGGIAGDQQAAAIGQCCFSTGMVKSTYGTGCFVLMNTGDTPATSKNKLLTTIAYQLNGKAHYALEGSIFIAGAAVQWLRDSIKLVQHASDTEALAASLGSNKGVYLVPAFTGLGAPYWNPEARGALFGLTRDTGVAEITRATLESIAYQTYDLIHAMSNDGIHPELLRVDGGMVKNNWLMQFLSDVLHMPVSRPVVQETTALGAAYLAGLQAGLYSSLDDIKHHWQEDKRFAPAMGVSKRDGLVKGWHKAVGAVMGFKE